MKAIFSVLGLLVVVAIVGVLAKNQLSAGSAPRTGAPTEAAVPAGTPKQQMQQVEQSVQGVMQQARPMPDNDK
jgi:predicted membrane-bound mannosyltransferase